jgi:hypothetical protein
MHPVVRAILQGGDGRTRLYNLGDENSALTGGWGLGLSGAPYTATKNTDNLYIRASGTAGGIGRATLETQSVVDFTNASKLKIRWKGTVESGELAKQFIIALVNAKLTSYNVLGVASLVKTATFAEEISEIDVSALTGAYYVKFQIYSNNGTSNILNSTMYEMWLE